jgi:O-succinylhomoserine sulfhydrylase
LCPKGQRICNEKNLKKRAKMVHGGLRCSQYSEVSEALFMTQGFEYDSAEAVEERFLKTDNDEFIYA